MVVRERRRLSADALACAAVGVIFPSNETACGRWSASSTLSCSAVEWRSVRWPYPPLYLFAPHALLRRGCPMRTEASCIDGGRKRRGPQCGLDVVVVSALVLDFIAAVYVLLFCSTRSHTTLRTSFCCARAHHLACSMRRFIYRILLHLTQARQGLGKRRDKAKATCPRQRPDNYSSTCQHVRQTRPAAGRGRQQRRLQKVQESSGTTTLDYVHTSTYSSGIAQRRGLYTNAWLLSLILVYMCILNAINIFSPSRP